MQPWLCICSDLLASGSWCWRLSQIGPPTSSARTSQQVVTAQKGVVQSTVSGSGNVEAGTDVTVNFNTSGTLARV